MVSDSSGGLHYTRDVTDPVNAPGITYSNPHHQRVGPRWVRGEIVYAMPLGVVQIDPEKTRWTKEYVVVYSVDGPRREAGTGARPVQYIRLQARRCQLQPHLAVPLCRCPADLSGQ
jgi:hypothetical protein